MKKICAILFSLLLAFRGNAADPIPPKLVGEWRNDVSGANYDVIDIAPDGTGYPQVLHPEKILTECLSGETCLATSPYFRDADRLQCCRRHGKIAG